MENTCVLDGGRIRALSVDAGRHELHLAESRLSPLSVDHPAGGISHHFHDRLCAEDSCSGHVDVANCACRFVVDVPDRGRSESGNWLELALDGGTPRSAAGRRIALPLGPGLAPARSSASHRILLMDRAG